MKRFFFLLFLFFAALEIVAQRATISGVVKDLETGETLIGANIYDQRSQQGAISNDQGFYTLSLPKGNEVSLIYSFIGYKEVKMSFTVSKDTVIHIPLSPSIELEELIVVADMYDTSVRGSQMSTVNIGSDQIKNIPTMFGEADLMKALQAMPGVQSGGDGSTGMYVRGGGPDENLIMLDGVPLYNVSHLLGFFSVFNTDAIKNVTLYKGSFPARFGSRLSSVVDVRTNSGNDNSYHGNVSLGLISAKLNVEGPIVKEKTTFNISARRTYFDLISKPILKARSKKNGNEMNPDFVCYFYDVNAKIEHRFNDKHRLSGNFYMGQDKLGFGYTAVIEENNVVSDQAMDFLFDWGNILGSLQYNGVLTNKLFLNSSLSYTHYKNKIGAAVNNVISEENETESRSQGADMFFDTKIKDLNFNVNFEYTPIQTHQIRFGANYIWHTFIQEYEVEQNMLSLDDLPIEIPSFENEKQGHEIALYIEDNFSLGRFFKANVGLRYSGFSVENTYYHSLEPRVSMRFLIGNNVSIKAAYSRMSQYVLLLASNNMSLPTDLWVPVTDQIKPMKSNQFSLGAFYELNHMFNFSVEGYYKLMNNVIEYKDGESLYSFTTEKIKEGIINNSLDKLLDWEEKVAVGKGYSYGVEFLVEKTRGKVTGLIGYTLAWSQRKFNEINNGNVFPARYDRRHDINVSVSYRINKMIDISAAWVFSTGNSVSMATQVYNTPEDFVGIEDETALLPTIEHIDSRNNYRLPNYHRLDLSANFTWEQKDRFAHILNISIFNTYCRYNPYLVFVSYDREKQQKVLKQFSIFPIIPSLSYTFKF